MGLAVRTPGLPCSMNPSIIDVPCLPYSSRTGPPSLLMFTSHRDSVRNSLGIDEGFRARGSGVGAESWHSGDVLVPRIYPSTHTRHTAYYHCKLSSNVLRSRSARSGAGRLHVQLKCSRANARVEQLMAPVVYIVCRSYYTKAGALIEAVKEGATRTFVENKNYRYGHHVRLIVHGSLHTLLDTSRCRSTSKRCAGVARCSVVDGFEMDLSSDSSREAAVPQSPKGVFPGGVRRAEVRLPGLVLRVRLEEMSREEQKNLLLEEINTAVAGGVTMIILEDSGDGGSGGARLYDAGCMLKTMLRGRAELLIAERVDIAAASGADGVLLTDEGLPAVVARRMMQNSGLETSVLPLVARCVSSVQSAQTATAGEGADLLILEVNDKEKNLVKGVCDGISIPVFLEISGSGVASAKIGTDFLQDGANGLVLSTAAITKNGGGDLPNYVSSLVASVNLAIERRKEMENSYSPEKEKEIKDFDVEDGGALLGLTEDVAVINLDMEEDSVKKKSKKIVDEERALLTAMVDFVEDASPEMEEVSLLVDALKQLDELFLSVVVGEFNSGKSSIINALLGKRYLKEGVLPTTNEITVLRHSTDGGDAEEREERHPDGHFLRFLPANILKQCR